MTDNIQSRKPILVTGSHRSGSTLVGKIIGAHPSVGYIHEPFNYRMNRQGVCNTNFDKFFTYINQKNEHLFLSQIEKTLNFSYSLVPQLKLVKSTKDLRYLLREYKSFQDYRSKKVRALLKDPFALFSSEWLAEKFSMDVIILIRHPAAFATSLLRLKWSYPFAQFLEQPLLIEDYLYPFEDEIKKFSCSEYNILDQATLLWKILYFMVIKHQEKHPNWLFLRLEDISENPLKKFQSIFNYLNLEFTEHVLSLTKDYCNSKNSNDLFTENPYEIKRPTNLMSKSWKTKLSSDEILYIRKSVEEVSCHFYGDKDW